MFPRKDVTWNWHHEYVCKLLQEFVLGDVDNLMVFMPPQHQKSTMMTEFLPPWVFGINPNAECLLTMYTSTIAAKYNRKVQRVIDSELYEKIFPETKLNSKNVVTAAKGNYVRNSEEFEIVNHRGFLKTVGVGGGIAGTPAKFTFMDDVIKNVAEANSPTYREKVWEWMTDELEARQHNDSKMVFTITRRHEDDLAGRLIERDGIKSEGGKWEVVVLPALKENSSNPNDPRKIGEPLFPELHSRERMEYIRDKNPRTFASLYQQRPAPLEGGVLKKHFFEIVDIARMPPAYFSIPKWFTADLAYTKNEQNDPTGVLCFRVFKNTLYLEDYMEYWEEFEENKDKIVDFLAKHDSLKQPIWIENKAGGLDMISSLRRNYGINAMEYKVGRNDKFARLMTVIDPFYADRVKIIKNRWNYSHFLNQCLIFPNGVHDEAVDTLTMAVNILEGNEGSFSRPRRSTSW